MHTCTRYATIPRSANPPDYAAARDASLPEHASHGLTNPTVWQPFPRKTLYISTRGSQDNPAAISGRKNRIEPLTPTMV